MQQDILDLAPEDARTQKMPYYLLMIEVGLLSIVVLLFLLGASVLHVPWLLFLVLIYGGIAAFIKPQFAKPKTAQIGMGIWNCLQLICFALAVFYMSKSFLGPSYYLRIISALLISCYYLSMIYFESDRLGSWRFVTVFFINLGFAIFFLGCLFKIESWQSIVPLLHIAPFLILIGFILLIGQLIVDRTKHAYYWFYLPRVCLLLISFFIS